MQPKAPKLGVTILPESILANPHLTELGSHLIRKNGAHSISSSSLIYWLTSSGTDPQCAQTAEVSSEKILLVFVASCKVLDFRLVTLPIYQER
jgi:hypothetical protein